MTVIEVPTLDLAPTVPSRVVYGTVLIPTEDRGPKGEWIEATIPGEIKLPGEHTTITGRSQRVPVNPDGSFQMRLPTIAEGIEPSDWALSMRLSWRKFAFPMRVPVGNDPIWIEDCIFPELMPSEDPAQYFLAGVQIRSVKTVGPDEPAKVRSDVAGGVLSMDLEIPRGAQGLPGPNAVPADEAVAGYINAAESSATRDALLTTLTTTGTRPVGKGEIVLNARDMGAIGDGAADDTVALQAALDQSAGRDVFLPHGRYRITDTLHVPSGGVVRGENGTVLVNDADLSTMIQTVGSAGTSHRLATPVGTYDREIETATPHGFEPGDIVRFTSQRVSTSADAGEWRLGFATIGGPGPFFGEHGTVQNVTSPTSFTLDTGLVFPGYRPDASQESDPDAGPYATVAKISGSRNVVISTLTLEGPSYTAVRSINAVDCLIENIRYIKYDTGRFIQFHTSYRCEARNCWVSNEVDVTEDLDHAHVNSYHVVASQATGFRNCTVISGTQGFDITYSQNGQIPSSFCYVQDCTSLAALDNHMTVHPGTYAAIVTGNNFSEGRNSGVSVRANRSLVANNTIRGSGERFGLYISEGGGKDSLITGNTVSGFEYGLSVNDGAGKQYQGRIGVTFSNNQVIDCRVGYTRSAEWQRPLPTTVEGIALIGNSFISDRPGAIGVETSRLGRPTWGLTVQGNTFHLSGGSTAHAVSVTNNSRGVAVIGNTMWVVGRSVERDDSGAAHEWSVPCVTEFTGNVVHRTLSALLPANTASWRLSSRDPEPHVPRAGYHLDQHRDTIAFRGGASSATTGNGFPAGAGECDVRVTRRSDTSTVQEVHTADGRMFHRAFTTDQWTAWDQRY